MHAGFYSIYKVIDFEFLVYRMSAVGVKAETHQDNGPGELLNKGIDDRNGAAATYIDGLSTKADF